MPKSPDAFRTISEVADWLGIQAHVLRFWESKFTQVKPIKRAGGRRYYRPNDMLLLGGIKKLLHDDGLTIKGVQKILREEGMNHVAAMSMPLDDLTAPDVEAPAAEPEPAPAPMVEDAEPETGVVLAFDGATEQQGDIKNAPELPDSDTETADGQDIQADAEKPQETLPSEPGEAPAAPEPTAQDATTEPAAAAPEAPDVEAEPASEQITPDPAVETATEAPPAPEPVEPSAASPEPVAEEAPPETVAEETETADAPAADETEMEPLPAFLRHPVDSDKSEEPSAETQAAEPETAQDNMPPEPEEPEDAPAPRARDIGMPEITPEAEIYAEPGALAAVLRQTRLSPAQVDQIKPLLTRLAALRDSMSAQRPPAAKD